MAEPCRYGVLEAGVGDPLSAFRLCGVDLSHRHLAFVESALALHIAVAKTFDAVLARFSRKSKIKIHTQNNTAQPLDRGLCGVGQRFTVEGGRTACALQVAPFTVPRAIAHLVYAEPTY